MEATDDFAKKNSRIFKVTLKIQAIDCRSIIIVAKKYLCILNQGLREPQ